MGRTYTMRVIGMMSGTSMDGVDAALLETDGEGHAIPGPWISLPYDDDFRQRLRHEVHEAIRRGAHGFHPRHAADVERDLTLIHARAVDHLLLKAALSPEDIDLIGFHGHSLLHRPDHKLTVQIGDGQLLADETGIDVVYDFRANDVASGGQGAPFAPYYHWAIAQAAGLQEPAAFLNLGGVGNVSWIGAPGAAPEILAYDTGPANALIDDWVGMHSGRRYDDEGRIAAQGRVDDARLGQMMNHPYFDQKPPKSLDRGDFGIERVEGMSLEDGAATLTAFTVAAVKAAERHYPAPAARYYVCGGGRHNATMMAWLRRELGAPVEPVDLLGIDGDALEAQAFAYLAARSRRGLPLSLPTTTGAPEPLTGGRFAEAKRP